MKFTTTSLTALVLSAIEVQGTWWNSKRKAALAYGNGQLISQPESNHQPIQYAWNNPPKFYQTTLNSFKRPVNSPADPQYTQVLEQALANDQLRSSRPVPGPYDIKTSKVKVRVTIQYNCQHLPSIASVQDRVNKDYIMRRLVGKKFSAVHVNRFKCNTPLELYADFVFYVYEEDTATFPEILPSLKPSLCRAVGIHQTDMAKNIRILPEQEIIEEAVNQVSTSISKAIAQIGQADASDIVDVAVNNIIEQDSTSVNNIVDDLVSVINVDKTEVVNDLVSKVEDQIRIELANKNTELKEVDETVRLVTEAIADETQQLLGSPTGPDSMGETSVTALMYTQFEDEDIKEKDLQNEEDLDSTKTSQDEGDIVDFLSGFAATNEDALDSIIEGIEIQGEEPELEDDLKAVLLEVTQAPMIDNETAEEGNQVSAQELANEIVFNFSQAATEGEEDEDKKEATLSESEIEEQAMNEFKDALMMSMNIQPETQLDQAENSPNSPSLEQTQEQDDTNVIDSNESIDQDIEDLNENPVISELLKFSEESNRQTENVNEITASIVEASEQVVPGSNDVQSPSSPSAPENDLVDMIASLSSEEIAAELEEADAQAEAEMDLFEDINDFANDFEEDEDSEDNSEDNSNFDLAKENDIVSTILEIQSSMTESQNQDNNINDEFSADDIYTVINSLVVDEAEGAGEEEILLYETFDSAEESLKVETGTVTVEEETINKKPTLEQTNYNANSTVVDEIIYEDILNTNWTSNNNNNEKIETIIKETEESLLNDKIIEKVVNSLIVEVPDSLIDQVASSRVNGTLSTVEDNINNQGQDVEESFINGVVETVINLFSS